MCDEFTGRQERMAQPQQAMADLEQSAYPGLSEGMVDIRTDDGACDAFFVHPGEGRHPGVIFWPDAIGLRDTMKTMARRVAAAGYAVLAVNQYYRTAHVPLGLSFEMFRDEASRAQVMPMIAALTPDVLTRDARAFVAFLDEQAAVDIARGIGTQGYCMGGGQAFRAGAASPERVRAVASFHGGGLVTDAPDSPHRLIAQTCAAFLILPGLDDDQREVGATDALRDAAAAAGRSAEIEVYNANHGWCVPDAPSYDRAEADRAHDRLLAVYAGL